MRLIDSNVHTAFQVSAPDYHRNSVHNEHIYRLRRRLITVLESHLQRIRTQTNLHHLHRPINCYKCWFRSFIELWRTAGTSRAQWLLRWGRSWIRQCYRKRFVLHTRARFVHGHVHAVIDYRWTCCPHHWWLHRAIPDLAVVLLHTCHHHRVHAPTIYPHSTRDTVPAHPARARLSPFQILDA